jgi:hypothetical protein
VSDDNIALRRTDSSLLAVHRRHQLIAQLVPRARRSAFGLDSGIERLLHARHSRRRFTLHVHELRCRGVAQQRRSITLLRGIGTDIAVGTLPDQVQ